MKKILKINFISVSFLLFALLLFFGHGKFYGYEGETYNAMYAYMQSGEIISQRAGIAAVLSHLPFVLLASISKIKEAPFLSLPFYTALSGSIFYVLIKNMYGGKRKALFLSFVLIFSTMMLPYSVFGMEHIFTFTALAAFTFIFLYSRNERSDFLVAGGVFAGLAAQTKAYGILFIIPLAIYLFLIIYKGKKWIDIKDYARKMTLFIAPVIFFILLGLWYNRMQFGSIFSTNYSLETELQPINLWIGIYGLLFSIGKGFFVYNPAAIVSIFCFYDFYKKFKREFIFILIFALIYIPFTAGFSFWTDEVWGPRKLLVLVPFVLLPIGCYLEKADKRKIALLASVVLLGFYINFLGTIYDYGKQLNLARRVNLDSLEKLRYVPEINHITVNSLFFRSYINRNIYGNSLEFYYEEKSWMRNLAGEENVTLSGGRVSLEGYERPDLLFLKK